MSRTPVDAKTDYRKDVRRFVAYSSYADGDPGRKPRILCGSDQDGAKVADDTENQARVRAARVRSHVAHERAEATHRRAAALHDRAAAFHQEHARAERDLGQVDRAKLMEERARREREKASDERHRARLAQEAFLAIDS